MKTKDADPVQQFILIFRKLYGTSNFIGLSERDRFEISGKELEEWLENPSSDILKRNLANDTDADIADEEREEEEETEETSISKENEKQLFLWDSVSSVDKQERDLKISIPEKTIFDLIRSKAPTCEKLNNIDEIVKTPVDNLILGLGFEERTEASLNRILNSVKPAQAICFKHQEAGRSDQILKTLNDHDVDTRILNYEEFKNEFHNSLKGNNIIDITGLSKPMIFHAVREAFIKNKEVVICHTKAQEYYPLDDDITKVLEAESSRDYYALLDSMGKILTGEIKPYSLVPLLLSDSDNTRRRIIFAFASAKHERLLNLLDERDYDNVLIVAQNPSAGRGKLARLSAEFATQNYPNTEVIELMTNDLSGAVNELLTSFHCWYVNMGFNFEVGLTGSKLQTVATAVTSTVNKFSQCWYVRPYKYDSKRFTKGVAETNFYKIYL